jgi:hypothetical protein
MTTAIYNKQENIYSVSISFYMWVDEKVPDYFESIMADYSWVMDEFNIHFFGLSDNHIQALSKLSIEYTLELKMI